MRIYLILEAKARQFSEDPEIQALLAELHPDGAALGPCSRAAAAARRLPDERLDQLVVELLLGIR